MPTDILAFTYASIVALGGVIGFVKAGSTVSLAMGLTFGTLIGLGARQVSADPRNVYFILFVSTLLGGVMGSRYANSGKFMPAGLIASMSAFMVLRYALRLLS